MAIDFYCSINEKVWNQHPVAPGPLACVSPVMGSRAKKTRETPIFVPDRTVVIQDSGAFCDDPGDRLSYKGAMERQIRHAAKYNYTHLIRAVASYDLLIDEKWESGVRRKRRWSESEAERAVQETIDAAIYLHNHRYAIPYRTGLILSAQGVTVNQYMECLEGVAPLYEKGDAIGLGGWCIIGIKRGKIMPTFERVIQRAIPYLASHRVNWIHIWGVLYAKALGKLLPLCDTYGMRLSTDSSGPQRRPAFGSWGYADWIDKEYKRPPTSTRGLERARHVQAVRDWLNGFRNTQYYEKGT